MNRERGIKKKGVKEEERERGRETLVGRTAVEGNWVEERWRGLER